MTEPYDYQEAGRLVYDCYCASMGNVEVAETPVVTTERDSHGKLMVRQPQQEPEKKPVKPWGDMSVGEKKKWVDMGLAAITHFSTFNIVIRT